MKLRQPMHPFIQNTLILVTSGVVASLLCAKVYAATLPVEEPTAPAPIAAVQPATPASTAQTDAQAAAQLRAMLMGQRQLLGTTMMAGTSR